MFKFNELSDLINGELVTPIKKVPEGVLCINKDGEQVIYIIDDFDFDKTPEERFFVVEDDSSDDSSEDIQSSDDSVSSEEDSSIEMSDLNKSHWVEDSYFKYSLCRKLGLDSNYFRKLLVWEE